jgi:hypothetical protein
MGWRGVLLYAVFLYIDKENCSIAFRGGKETV